MEMVDAAEKGVIRGYYVMGENPMMSEPNEAHTREAIEAYLAGYEYNERYGDKKNWN